MSFYNKDLSLLNAKIKGRCEGFIEPTWETKGPTTHKPDWVKPPDLSNYTGEVGVKTKFLSLFHESCRHICTSVTCRKTTFFPQLCFHCVCFEKKKKKHDSFAY